ncbi:MAG: Rpn family recombination-promoting nuclease/putative transposase [Armatimonadetes bacterium]|nr:Rpn family recombination-promoting nuclease/putative transposase [Armatimonadota bacterium]
MEQAPTIDHDRLFKELLTTFFVEFIELFFPKLAAVMDRDSIVFLDKEVFISLFDGREYEADIVARVRFANTETEAFFLIHVENQSTPEADFGRRMLRYFTGFFEKYDLPVYPIVVFSYDKPARAEPTRYTIGFPDGEVLRYSYRVVQLNRLSWRKFVSQHNPIASALMAKMKIAEQDRPRVKLECLRLLATLKLDPARMRLISGFVDTYLRLSRQEIVRFEQANCRERSCSCRERGSDGNRNKLDGDRHRTWPGAWSVTRPTRRHCSGRARAFLAFGTPALRGAGGGDTGESSRSFADDYRRLGRSLATRGELAGATHGLSALRRGTCHVTILSCVIILS